MASGRADGGRAADPEAALFRRLLQERMARAHAQIGRLGSEIREVTLSQRDIPADDEHDPEGSTVSVERERDVVLLAGAEAQLSELRAAAARLAAGTFGICERCGEPIPRGRLEARPEARFCLPCVSQGAR
jgi:RNA polymerase-binding transcription factor DksA